MYIINKNEIEKVFKKCKIQEYNNQIILFLKDFKINISKDVIDIIIIDSKGNKVQFFEHNGIIKRVVSKRILNKKMRMLSKFFNINIFKIYNLIY